MWRSCLWAHSDTDFVNDLLHDIEFGVRIGYQPVSRDYQIHTNHLSAILNPEPVAREIERELDLNRKVGPFLTPPFENFTGSPLGAIPKKHSAPVKWRIIHDLSWPAGLSVNDGIPKDLFTCTYDSIDRAITLLKQFGTGALMSKLDLSDAFRHILVNAQDWELLGSTWPVEIDGTVVPGYFIDTFLPFGLRSSPALFLKFVEGLKFVMSSRGASPIWNYLEDFWTCGPPSPNPHCRTSLNLMLGTCEHLGFTTNPAKTVLPTTNLILLGIELDSLAQEARIDQTRLAEVLHMLDKWSSRKHCTKRQLQSLIGKLHFISSVCRPGRTFVRRLIDLLSKASHPSHRIRLTVAFRKDIHWWQTFLTSWNGCSFFYQDTWLPNSSLDLFTDASHAAFGAHFAGEWFSCSFSAHRIPLSRSITFKELYAITAAVSAWAPSLASHNVMFHCDNQSVVHILSSGTSRCKHIMSMLRYLFYVCANYNILLRAIHIPGVSNCFADCLSRLQVSKFHRLCPAASEHPTFVPRVPLTNFK